MSRIERHEGELARNLQRATGCTYHEALRRVREDQRDRLKHEATARNDVQGLAILSATEAAQAMREADERATREREAKLEAACVIDALTPDQLRYFRRKFLEVTGKEPSDEELHEVIQWWKASPKEKLQAYEVGVAMQGLARLVNGQVIP